MTELTHPRRGRPARRAAPNARERLLAAARTEFGDRGFGATTLEHLLSAAHVNPPTLYHHFGGKRGLFVQAAHVAYAEVLSALRAAVPPATDIDFDDAIDALLATSVQIVGKDLALSKLFLVIQFELPRQKSLADELRPMLQDFRSFFDDVARRAPAHLADTDAQRRDLARALIAIINGINGEALLLRRPQDYPSMITRLQALLHRHD